MKHKCPLLYDELNPACYDCNMCPLDESLPSFLAWVNKGLDVEDLLNGITTVEYIMSRPDDGAGNDDIILLTHTTPTQRLVVQKYCEEYAPDKWRDSGIACIQNIYKGENK